MNKLIIFLVIITTVLSSQHSNACSCFRKEEEQGFYSSKETKSLPSNARGLLFTRYDFNEKLTNADFFIVDKTNKQKISAKVVRLEPGFVENTDPGFLPLKNIYRIEPTKPFIPGHKYQFTFEKVNKFDRRIVQSRTVEISKKVLSKKALAKASFSFIDTAEVRTIQVEQDGSCLTEIDALVQEVGYDFPPELKEFQDSILFFTAYSKESKKFSVWQYRKSTCIDHQTGRSGHAFGHDLIYIPNDDKRKNSLRRGTPYSVKGTWMAPELDDTLYSSNEFPFSYPKSERL